MTAQIYRKPSFLKRDIVVLMGITGVFASPIAICFMLQFWSAYDNKDFCIPNDEVYQAIATQADEWVAVFKSRRNSFDLGARRMSFKTASGEAFTASASLWNIWNIYSQPIIYVVVETNWNKRLGDRGYIFTHIPNLEINEYRIIPINPNLYCYYYETWSDQHRS